MIAEHSATVLPITDALLRAPKDRAPRVSAPDQAAVDGPLPDNVIVLARFSRQARRSHGRFWLGGPPEGDAA
jgi:hypothetical protein